MNSNESKEIIIDNDTLARIKQINHRAESKNRL